MVTHAAISRARARRPRDVASIAGGFTIVELLVVLAAMGLLLAIAAPRYIRYLDNARDVALRQDLMQMREAIDKFQSDQARYPATLDELVTLRYLRSVPVDPITQRNDTWRMVGPAGGTQQGVADLHSGATGQADDGSAYASW